MFIFPSWWIFLVLNEKYKWSPDEMESYDDRENRSTQFQEVLITENGLWMSQL